MLRLSHIAASAAVKASDRQFWTWLQKKLSACHPSGPRGGSSQ